MLGGVTSESLPPQDSRVTGLTFLVKRFMFSETWSKAHENSFLTKAYNFYCQVPMCFIPIFSLPLVI